MLCLGRTFVNCTLFMARCFWQFHCQNEWIIILQVFVIKESSNLVSSLPGGPVQYSLSATILQLPSKYLTIVDFQAIYQIRHHYLAYLNKFYNSFDNFSTYSLDSFCIHQETPSIHSACGHLDNLMFQVKQNQTKWAFNITEMLPVNVKQPMLINQSAFRRW